MPSFNDFKTRTTLNTEQETKVRPTLYIGLGGTGMEIMMHMRRRILNSNWGHDKVLLKSLSQFPIAQFIHFDLDAYPTINKDHVSLEDLEFNLVKFNDDEKISELSKFEKYTIDDSLLNHYPHIKNWFPFSKHDCHCFQSTPYHFMGSRPVSRLYFFDKYKKIKDKIRLKLNKLKLGIDYENDHQKLNLELDNKNFRIVVIGSLSGGTGSGTFLDMGWLSKWIASTEVEAAEVELVMILPTGYSIGKNLLTESNGYAALMELESAMIGNSKYVEQWDEHDHPQLAMRPYDEVYLIDSINLAHQHTDYMRDVFSMVADTLFEDFHSTDFAKHKRSIAVNQRQHKAHMFSSPLPTDRFADVKLNFSSAYSSFGLSTLESKCPVRYDEYIYRLASNMLKAFFSITNENPSSIHASQKQCNDFMSEYMYTELVPFSNLPEFSAENLKSLKTHDLNHEFMNLNIVETLLRSCQAGTEIDILDETRQRVSQCINKISHADRDQWPVQVRIGMENLLKQVICNPNTKGEAAEDQIIHRRKVIFESMKKEIESRIFFYACNQELGGFEFAISLVELIKKRIENANTGICIQLENLANHFTAIKDVVQTYEYEKRLKNLETILDEEFLSLGLDISVKEEQSRSILDHLCNDLSNILAFHLKAKAATEAIELMKDISNWLGHSSGLNKNDKTIWNGVLGDLLHGQNAVIRMIKHLAHKNEITRTIRPKQKVLHIIEPDTLEERNIDTRLLREWTNKAFEDFGGPSDLFRVLMDPKQQSTILFKIIRAARQYLTLYEQAVQKDHTLYDSLNNMSIIERKNVFSKWLQDAMPWIDARMDEVYSPPSNRFKCHIGVNGAKQFSEKFKHELISCIPSDLGINAQAMSFFEANETGRAMCYVELSGIPLAILRGIETWRTSYHRQSGNRKLHTHIDSTRFKHPYVPTVDELNILADDFKCYLKAVMLGVLKHCDLPNLTPAGQYVFSFARGDTRRLGNERSFRMNGLPQFYRDNIYEQVQQKFNTLSSNANLIMLIALTDYYEREVYTPRLVQNEAGDQVVQVGFACAITKELKRELLALAKLKQISEADIERACELNKSHETLEKWAEVIKDSHMDAYQEEISEDNKSSRLKWALNMSPIILQQHEQLLHFKKITSSTQHQYHIALNGQSYGPYAQESVLAMLYSQQINATTLVWHAGLTNWVPILNCPELMIIE